MKKKVIFVIGGCRSGKSRYALELAERSLSIEKIFMATCVPHDDEMKQRVANHQAERGENWKTIETPALLPEAIETHSTKDSVILADCLTLWINNLLMETEDTEVLTDHIEKLGSVLKSVPGTVILVSNEVGTGIVPENRLARLFRDMAGYANQRVAACADRVIWMVAGIPVQIKPAAGE